MKSAVTPSSLLTCETRSSWIKIAMLIGALTADRLWALPPVEAEAAPVKVDKANAPTARKMKNLRLDNILTPSAKQLPSTGDAMLRCAGGANRWPRGTSEQQRLQSLI